jgi:ATP-dependent 26S proteasome regulatory subunit
MLCTFRFKCQISLHATNAAAQLLLLPSTSAQHASFGALTWLLVCSHAIVSSLVGPEYYVNIMSFVDKTQLEPGCSILLHNKVSVQAST